MPINPQYLVAAIDLSEVFLDKDTGQPLSGGIVSFFQDSDHITPKLVYTIQNNNPALPPVYTYIPLPNPITLSATGQFQDNAGNNIPVYYYPVDANGNEQLYYITVTNSAGVQQFIRQGWPPNESQILPPPAQQINSISNQITNSQFLDVNFVPANGITFNYVGNAIDTIAIAPDWSLVVNHTGNGTLFVTRTAVQGSSAYPNNPPYTLTVTPGVNIAALQLVQTFPNNPDVFSPQPAALNGYLSASILLAPASVATISYQPNGQAAQQILNANNTTGNYATFNNTVQLAPATNPSTGDTGSVSIIVGLNVAAATTFSNVQVVPLNANIANVPYDQITANRDRDLQFNYWEPLLKAKTIPSYLIGWDFPLNPTQPLGPTVAASAAGVNSAIYTWDQTILFQVTNSGPATSRAASGAMRITATNASQFALVQYLPQSIARELLNGPLSVNVAALTPQIGGIVGTISLWYTNNGALPNIGANTCLITTLDANGHPSAVAAGWSEVPRSNLGNAQFVVQNSATTAFNDYGFSGWNLNGIAAVNTTTFFAIVVGFAQLNLAGTMDISSISLVPGMIPTRPAAKSISATLEDCQTFYEMSFNPGVIPATQLGTASGMAATVVGTAVNAYVSLSVQFVTTKRSIPTTITTYNPVNNNAQGYDITIGGDNQATTVLYPSKTGFYLKMHINAGSGISDDIGVYWTADSRLGF